MTEVADVPLICDPVPGPPGGFYYRTLVGFPGKRDPVWIEMVAKSQSADPMQRPAFSPPQWPDAEFCAA